MRSCIERALKFHDLEETRRLSWASKDYRLSANSQQIGGGLENWLLFKSALGRNRTCDQKIRSLLLYPLSYEGSYR